MNVVFVYLNKQGLDLRDFSYMAMPQCKKSISLQCANSLQCENVIQHGGQHCNPTPSGWQASLPGLSKQDLNVNFALRVKKNRVAESAAADNSENDNNVFK